MNPSLTPFEPPRLTPAVLRIYRSRSRVSLATVYRINAGITERKIEDTWQFIGEVRWRMMMLETVGSEATGAHPRDGDGDSSPAADRVLADASHLPDAAAGRVRVKVAA